MKLSIIIISAILAISYADFSSDCISVHNDYRIPLGLPEMKWSDDLAKSAQKWADHLAATNSFQHSHTEGQGENIAWATIGYSTIEQYVDGWAEEEQYFIKGKNFPDCSNTGNWLDVAHYTQMVWKKTTEVGCGLGTGSRKEYFVCQYTVKGNINGEPVY